MCGAGSRAFSQMFVRIPFLTDVTAKKEPLFFFFKKMRIVSNNLLPKVFLHSNANPPVKQERLIQKYLLF